MGKSVRINISLPHELHGVFAEVAQRTGVSVPQVLVNALAQQSAYARRWMATCDYRPRDVAPSPAEPQRVVTVERVPDAAATRPGPSRKAGRAVRRAEARMLRKLKA